MIRLWAALKHSVEYGPRDHPRSVDLSACRHDALPGRTQSCTSPIGTRHYQYCHEALGSGRSFRDRLAGFCAAERVAANVKWPLECSLARLSTAEIANWENDFR